MAGDGALRGRSVPTPAAGSFRSFGLFLIVFFAAVTHSFAAGSRLRSLFLPSFLSLASGAHPCGQVARLGLGSREGGISRGLPWRGMVCLGCRVRAALVSSWGNDLSQHRARLL